MRRPAGAALAVVSLAGALVVGGPAPARAAEPDGSDCAGVNQVDTEPDPPTVPSAPLESLRIAEAQALVRQRTGAEPGSGVAVAVVDSGVEGTHVQRAGPPGGELLFYHGTTMAGVIAGQSDDGDGGDGGEDGVGRIGIAPGATIYDARFYDTTNRDDGTVPTRGGLVDALTALLPQVGRGAGQVSIVTVALTVEDDSPGLEAAVQAITDKGAIVVASSGNRVSETEPQSDDDEPDDSAYEFGEDVTLFPAGYATTNSRVVSVGTTTDAEFEDPNVPQGLLSSSIDVVVPTFGAVSYGINRSTCSFFASSTSVAAAEVAGILALLRAAFPNDSPEQLIARLEVTATGGAAPGDGAVDKFRGRGVVQPMEALTRPLQPTRDGVVGPGPQPPADVAPAALPQSQPDVLRSTRRNAVWWGLFGGGALVVALLLRPVLSRRRTPRA